MIFLLKLSLSWSFFALLYTWLLRHETFFRANRAYLLGTMVLGIVLAAIPAEQVYESAAPVMIMPVFTVGLQQVETVSSQWQNIDYLWVIYWLGFALLASRLFWGLIKLGIMIHRGSHERLSDGTRLVHTTATQTPFSFFQWIFIPNLSSQTGVAKHAILAHERAHARGWHSADVLLAEILCVVFWFHPLSHWYKRALRAVHEYLADAAASRVSDKKQYGLLLIGQSQFEMPVAFANHFFQSPLKQRLVMLTKNTSSPIRALKFGLAVPMALLFALLFRQAPAMAQVVDPVKSKPAETAVTASDTVDPEFPGGTAALMQYLSDNVTYPPAAKAANAEGMVVVNFVVQQDGSISDIKEVATRPNHPDLVTEAIRVVSTMPKWKPAVKEGKIVKMQFTLPIRFKLAPEAPKELFDVDKVPEFPGGQSAMMEFLVNNIKYPEEARKAEAAGIVAITFVVEKDGSLSSFETLRTPRPDMEEEAIRVLKLMPKFTPAMKDGKAVSVKYTLPIKFAL